ncbi:MAG TPA: CpsB/CapC family capsule biosynthesis tyrosine phosphatase, partial [Tepidisphaeraceae bacterium]|nr:CpsB/CapC family capsule biosynthesis tyrosine phosphatase [Tepidisphaeraceae bacterium]
LLPGIDDGCKTVAESIACARLLVEAGYTHSFCTPHIWPSLPNNSSEAIPGHVANLQRELDKAGVGLKLLPGGELNMGPHLLDADLESQPTFGMNARHVLIDLWCDALPDYFEKIIRRFQKLGRTVILAHPERMRAVQDSPELAEEFASMGILLQGNLGCLNDSPRSDTRQTAEKLLREDRYFLLGMDLHNLQSLPPRLAGLKNARQLVGEEKVDELTKINPCQLDPSLDSAD